MPGNVLDIGNKSSGARTKPPLGQVLTGARESEGQDRKDGGGGQALGAWTWGRGGRETGQREDGGQGAPGAFAGKWQTAAPALPCTLELRVPISSLPLIPNKNKPAGVPSGLVCVLLLLYLPGSSGRPARALPPRLGVQQGCTMIRYDPLTASSSNCPAVSPPEPNPHILPHQARPPQRPIGKPNSTCTGPFPQGIWDPRSPGAQSPALPDHLPLSPPGLQSRPAPSPSHRSTHLWLRPL